MGGARQLAAAAPVALLALAVGCASMQAPPGGPVDTTPPVLIGTQPDSGSTGLAGLREIRLRFSEKMEPQAASRFLRLYPPLEVKKTRWPGLREAVVELLEPLPPDTVVVVELMPGLSDRHRVRSETARSFPLASADSLPLGEVRGQLVLQEKPLAKGVVELYAVPPDTLEYFQQPLLRRATTDADGTFRLRWLPVPGGPWLVRGFADDNGDLRPGEREAQRLLPGRALLSADSTSAYLGLTVLYDPGTPGRLDGHLAGPVRWPGRVFAWPLKVGEEDEGFAPEPQRAPPNGQIAVTAGDTVTFAEAGPGPVQLVFFVDADGDSLFGLLPGAAAAGDSGDWYFEPFAVVEGLTVEPGLPGGFPAPVFGDTLAAWRPPAAGLESEEGP